MAAKILAACCEMRNISIEAVFIAGELNVVADRESRAEADASDWQLAPFVFSKMREIWEMDTDLFDAPWNAQLQSFVSWKPQSGSMAINAFSISWDGVKGYAPPFVDIRCLEKLRREEATIVLICPIRPGQPWFPVILEHACDILRLLIPAASLVTSAQGASHPLLQSGALKLAAWRLSGESQNEEYHLQTIVYLFFPCFMKAPFAILCFVSR
jgi:hypothetical protein